MDRPKVPGARIPDLIRTACFFAPVADREGSSKGVEFYKQDVDVLEQTGIPGDDRATRWREIPWDCDFYFVWWNLDMGVPASAEGSIPAAAASW